jgi:hypothetical protein
MASHGVAIDNYGIGQPIGDTEELFVPCARQVAMTPLTRNHRGRAGQLSDGNGEYVERRIEGMDDLNLLLPKISNELGCGRKERFGT